MLVETSTISYPLAFVRTSEYLTQLCLATKLFFQLQSVVCVFGEKKMQKLETVNVVCVDACSELESFLERPLSDEEKQILEMTQQSEELGLVLDELV